MSAAGLSHRKSVCTSKPEGGTAALLEPGCPTPPLPFLSLSFLPIFPSLTHPSSVITAVLQRHAGHFDHRTRGGERVSAQYRAAGHRGWCWRIWHLFHSWWNSRSGNHWCAYKETTMKWESDWKQISAGQGAEGRRQGVLYPWIKLMNPSYTAVVLQTVSTPRMSHPCCCIF